MHVAKATNAGNANIGLYTYATDEFVLVGADASDEYVDILKKVLKVPVHKVHICGTSLIGIFIIGKDKTLCVPSIAFDHEIKALEDLGFTVAKVETAHTALGNMIVVCPDALIASTDVEASALKQIKDALSISQSTQVEIADTNVVGSALVYSKNGSLVHPQVSDEVFIQLEKLTHTKLTKATVNWGSPYILSGLVCNKNGFLVGETSSGPEVTNADEGLGFINND
ncbi:MAG: putative translation initiation factor eIF-6 [Candidatus Woesearchaeota archaeon]|jgi:putative translation initiation factor eIF-6